MRRYIVSREEDYFGLIDFVEGAYENDEVLELSGVREGVQETIHLMPSLIERRKVGGIKILEFIGVEVETLGPFIAKSEHAIDELDQPSVIEVEIREKTS